MFGVTPFAICPLCALVHSSCKSTKACKSCGLPDPMSWTSFQNRKQQKQLNMCLIRPMDIIVLVRVLRPTKGRLPT